MLVSVFYKTKRRFIFVILVLLINTDYIKIKKNWNYAFYNFLCKKTTTVYRSSDGGLLTLGCSSLFPSMGSIIVAKKFNFAFDGQQNFLEIVIIMLQKGVCTK